MKWLYSIIASCVPIMIMSPGGGMQTVLQCCSQYGGCQIVVM